MIEQDKPKTPEQQIAEKSSTMFTSAKNLLRERGRRSGKVWQRVLVGLIPPPGKSENWEVTKKVKVNILGTEEVRKVALRTYENPHANADISKFSIEVAGSYTILELRPDGGQIMQIHDGQRVPTDELGLPQLNYFDSVLTALVAAHQK